MNSYQSKQTLLLVLCVMTIQTLGFAPMPLQPAVGIITSSRGGAWLKSLELPAVPHHDMTTTKQQQEDALCCDQSSSLDSKNRRALLFSASTCFVLTVTQPKKVMALQAQDGDDVNTDQEDNNFQFQIITSLPKGMSKTDFSRNSALVITVKPAVTYTDQVPKEIADASLAATGHWVPIVLRSRQKLKLCSEEPSCDDNINKNSKSSTNRLTTTLTLDDVTSEAGTNLDWWKKLPLIVTAKVDTDGQDSTVQSLDLVGCRIIPNNGGLVNSNKQLTMPLQRRGLCSDLLLSTSTKQDPSS